MKNKEYKFLGLVGIVFFGWLAVSTFAAKRDFSVMPFGVVGHLRIGDAWNPTRRGIFNLVCTHSGEIKLLIKKNMSKRSYLRIGAFDEAVLFIGNEESRIAHEYKLNRIALISNDRFDTLLSAPLSRSLIDEITFALSDISMERISLYTMERGLRFSLSHTARKAAAFANRCRE